MKYEILNNKILQMKDEIISSIQAAVKINSVKGKAKTDAPYGIGPKNALDFTLALGKQLGFKTGCCGNRVGWIEYGDGEEMVGVLGHLDVVPIGEGWKYPAFSAEIHDNKIYGRGVLDDKGPVIGAIYGLKAIRDLNLPIKRRIRVMFGTDEECGSSCVKYYIENGEELPTVGFTPDADYPLIFCEKGTTNAVIGGKIKSKGNIDVIRFEGGVAPNVVTPKCILSVKGDIAVTETDGITVIKENGITTVEAIGIGAHGSTPRLGKNAAVMLANAVKCNDFGGDFQNMLNFILKYLNNETNGVSLGINYHDEETGETTVNLGMLKYDGEEMKFTLDIRYPKNAVTEDVKKQIYSKALLFGMEVDKLVQVPILYISKDSELVEKLLRVYEIQTGISAEPLAIGGGTYAKAFPNMVAFGPMFPGDADVIHQPNECADIDKLIKSFQISAAAMLELAQK